MLVLDRGGRLLQDVVLGEGDAYHPGGIDFDGRSVWVPVAEYRPNSAAIVYRLDPATLPRPGGVPGARPRRRRRPRPRHRATSTASAGARARCTAGRRTAGSWRGAPTRTTCSTTRTATTPAYRKQLCSGVTGLPAPGGGAYELGGLALRDLRTGRHPAPGPVPACSPPPGHVVTRNPVALEVRDGVLRLFAAPDDGEEGAGTELLVYETPLAP